MSAGMVLAGTIELTPAQETFLLFVLVVLALAFVGVVLLVIAGFVFLVHHGRTDPGGLKVLRRARVIAMIGGVACLPFAILWIYSWIT